MTRTSTATSPRSSGPTTSGSSPTRGSRSSRLYDEDDVAPGLEERLGEPGAYPFTRGIHERMYRDRLWTMRQYAGFATPEDTNERYRYLTEHGSTGLSMAFDLPTQLGRDSDDPLCAGRGRPHRRPDRHDRGHADLLRPDLARRGLDLDDDQRPRRDPAAALRAGRRGAGRPVEGAARHGPERRAQGVHRARQLHLPARADDAADHRHLRLLRRERPEVEHDLDQRLPHPREGLLGRAGGRLHPRQRDRLRRGRDRGGPRRRRVRPAPRLLLQRPQQRLPGDRQVPRRPPDVGEDHEASASAPPRSRRR